MSRLRHSVYQMAAEHSVLRDIVIASKGVNDQVNGHVISMDPGMLGMRSYPAVGEAPGNVCRCGSTKIQKHIGNCRVLCVCGKTYFKNRARKGMPRCPCAPKRSRNHHVVANVYHAISKVRSLCAYAGLATSQPPLECPRKSSVPQKQRELAERVDHITVVWRVLHVREQCQMTYLFSTRLSKRKQGHHNVCTRGLSSVGHKCA